MIAKSEEYSKHIAFVEVLVNTRPTHLICDKKVLELICGEVKAAELCTGSQCFCGASGRSAGS